MTAQEAEMLMRLIQKLEEENKQLKDDLTKITRFELINHSTKLITLVGEVGRVLVIKSPFTIEISRQDEGKTLKVFLS